MGCRLPQCHCILEIFGTDRQFIWWKLTSMEGNASVIAVRWGIQTDPPPLHTAEKVELFPPAI